MSDEDSIERTLQELWDADPQLTAAIPIHDVITERVQDDTNAEEYDRTVDPENFVTFDVSVEPSWRSNQAQGYTGTVEVAIETKRHQFGKDTAELLGRRWNRKTHTGPNITVQHLLFSGLEAAQTDADDWVHTVEFEAAFQRLV